MIDNIIPEFFEQEISYYGVKNFPEVVSNEVGGNNASLPLGIKIIFTKTAEWLLKQLQ